MKHQFRQRLRSGAVVAAAALLVGSLTVLPASAAEPAVPQAPVLSIIGKDEVLPFTLDGGGAIEVAVLAQGQSPTDAVWSVRSTLPLAEFHGRVVRVLARAAGVTDPTQWFDASYDVRGTYPPGSGLGTEADPDVSIPVASPLIRSWPSGVANYTAGTAVSPSFQTPNTVVGKTGLVVLGDNGSITLEFDRTVVDRTGADFVVIENGFRVGASGLDFVELGRVSVSSNGTDFVTFDSASRWPTPVGGFAGMAATDIGGLAGRDLAGRGTPFDLTALRNKPTVRSGLVDLQAISHIRIDDIKGDGSHLDSFGRKIYDPDPTSGSAGFDLVGVGAIHIASVAVSTPILTWVNSTTGRWAASIAAGSGGAQQVRLELSRTDDHSDAVSVATGTVPAEGAVDFSWTVGDLERTGQYWFRVVSDGGAGGAETPWTSVVRSPAALSLGAAPLHTRVENAARTTFRGSLAAGTDGPQEVAVEYSTAADFSAPVTGVFTPASGSSLNLAVDGLQLGTPYWYRFVARGSDGVLTRSAVGTTTTTVPASSATPVAVARIEGRARVTAAVNAGTDRDLEVRLQYADNSTFTQNAVLTPPTTISGDVAVTDLAWDLVGLDPTRTVHARAVLTLADGTVRTSSTLAIYAGTAPILSPPTAVPAAITATVSGQINTATWGPLQVVAEYRPVDGDPAQMSVTEPVTVPARTSQQPGFELTGLVAGTQYQARLRATTALAIGEGWTATTDWVVFSTVSPEPALGAVTVTEVQQNRAVLTVAVTPGRYDRALRAEIRPVGGEVTTFAAEPVPAGDGTVTRTVVLDGLLRDTDHQWRVVSTALGSDEATDWADLHTPGRSSTVADDVCRTGGVSVVVDLGAAAPTAADRILASCVQQDGLTALETLQRSGSAVTEVPDRAGAVCTVAGRPESGCAEGGWTSWTAVPGGHWVAADGTDRLTTAGGVEGWRWIAAGDPVEPPSAGPGFIEGVDITAPVVTVVSGPADVGTQTSATVEFAVDDPGAAVTCTLDQGVEQPCPAPATGGTRSWTVEGLTFGRHTLTLRATDLWANSTTQRLELLVSAGDVALTTPTVSAVTDTSVTIGWSLVPGPVDRQVFVEYGPAAGDFARAAALPWRTETVTVPAGPETVDGNVQLAGLGAGTAYLVRVVVSGADEVFSSETTATTAAAPEEPGGPANPGGPEQPGTPVEPGAPEQPVVPGAPGTSEPGPAATDPSGVATATDAAAPGVPTGTVGHGGGTASPQTPDRAGRADLASTGTATGLPAVLSGAALLLLGAGLVLTARIRRRISG